MKLLCNPPTPDCGFHFWLHSPESGKPIDSLWPPVTLVQPVKGRKFNPECGQELKRRFPLFCDIISSPASYQFLWFFSKTKMFQFSQKNFIVLLCSWQSGVILFNSYHHNLIVVYFIGCWVISSTRCFCNELKRPNILFPTLSSRFT